MPTPEFYKATDVSSLLQFEGTCERDEDTHTAELISLERVENDGVKGTEAMYNRVPLTEKQFGLVIDDYRTEAEANLKEAQHQLFGHTKMFRGEIFIGEKNVKVVVLREKQ